MELKMRKGTYQKKSRTNWKMEESLKKSLLRIHTTQYQSQGRKMQDNPLTGARQKQTLLR